MDEDNPLMEEEPAKQDEAAIQNEPAEQAAEPDPASGDDTHKPEHVEGEAVDGELLGEATTASHTDVGEGGEEEMELYEEEIEEEVEGEDGVMTKVTKKVTKKRKIPKKEKELDGEGGEHVMGEYGEGVEEEQKPTEEKVEEQIEEEDVMEEEPPPDPAAPYNLSDSKELLRTPFQLRTDQLAEVEQLWELYQNHTPAYADLDNFITEVELVYLLKCLLIMTHTPEQMQELIDFCVRPPSPEGHINFDQFVHMVTIRQRDFVPEEELRAAMHVYDPEGTGLVDREYLREVLTKQGHKMNPKLVDNLIKEVDMSNDGTIGCEDVVGTLAIDLNREDIEMLIAQLNPEDKPPPPPEDV